jgi:hypothetical protein
VFSGSTYSLVTVAVGSASNTIVSSGGEVLIEAGGNTTGTVLLGATTSFSFGASEYVESGATATGTTVNTSSTEYLYGGTTTGTMVHSGGAQVIVSGTALNDVVSAGGGVADSGTLAYTEAAGTSSSFVGTLTGSGALVQSGPGTLALAGTLGNFSGTELISGGTLELTSATAGGNTSASITFTPGNAGTLRLDGTTAPANTISGFTNGDLIDLASLGYSGTATPTVSGNTVTVTEGSITETLVIAGASNDAFLLASDGNGGTDVQIACYCPGTLILTDRGEVPVEQLAIGDLVTTITGHNEPIRWIGRRSYAGRFLAGKQHLLPILIQTGALGGGLPQRDLRVSPNHAMFINGVLVPAGQLVNGVSILQERDCRRVDYIHIELAEHRVIWAEGAPSETYLDDDNRGMFHNAGEFAALYGTETPRPQYYAPRIEAGFELEAIRMRLTLLADSQAAA